MQKKLGTMGCMVFFGLCGVLAICSVRLAIADGGPPETHGVIKARQFVVVSPNGKVAAELGFSEKPFNSVSLKMYDNKEIERLTLMLIPSVEDGPLLIFKDSAGRQRMGIGVGNSEPEIDMFNAHGQRNLSLRACDQTGSGILLSAKGKVRAMLLSKYSAALFDDDEDAPKTTREAENSGSLILFDGEKRVAKKLP